MPGLPFDPRHALACLASADPVLGRLIERVGPFGLKLKRGRETFEVLAESIVYQQLNGRAAETILGRVRALFPAGRIEPRALLARPEPALRGAGLSAAKLAALRDLSAKTLDGTVPPLAKARRLADEALVERLTRVRGVGPWTAHMFLIFRLGRPDVLPVGDFAVRKAFGLLYRKRGHPAPAALERHGERWRPWRSVATWYLWRSLELPAPGRGPG